MKNKKCSSCNDVKPITEFHRRTDSEDGHKNQCKKCVSENRKLLYYWKKNDPEKYEENFFNRSQYIEDNYPEFNVKTVLTKIYRYGYVLSEMKKEEIDSFMQEYYIYNQSQYNITFDFDYSVISNKIITNAIKEQLIDLPNAKFDVHFHWTKPDSHYENATIAANKSKVISCMVEEKMIPGSCDNYINNFSDYFEVDESKSKTTCIASFVPIEYYQ